MADENADSKSSNSPYLFTIQSWTFIFFPIIYLVFDRRLLKNIYLQRKLEMFYLTTHSIHFLQRATLSYLSMLKGVTISGKVRFCAILLGTPTWYSLRLGSGVMTVRPEKSTRFPIKLPRTRPSFPFSLCFIDFRGRPDF